MQKDEKLNITKDKLLEATFLLMEEADDPLAVTSRQIADRAGVNCRKVPGGEPQIHKGHNRLRALQQRPVAGVIQLPVC